MAMELTRIKLSPTFRSCWTISAPGKSTSLSFIAKSLDPDAAWRCEERKRDRHVDLAQTAFLTEPRERCEPYLAHVRTLPCLICAGSDTEAAQPTMRLS